MKAIEIQIIKKFFRLEKQQRYINFVSSSKNRKKFIEQLAHLKDLRWDLFTEVSSFNVSLISSQLRNLSCYVISEDPAVDGTLVPLEKISSLTDTGFALILIFGQGDQIYFEGEPPFNRYISNYIV